MNCTDDCNYCNNEYCRDERRDDDGLEDFTELGVTIC